MIEVCHLTLFHNFFKSNFKRHVRFIIILACFFISRTYAFSFKREISLYPSQYIQIIDNKEENKSFRLGLTESIVNLNDTPCLFIFHQIPLLFSVIQPGINCGLNISKKNTISFSLTPEIYTNKKNRQYEGAIGVGFSDNLDLTNNKGEWLAVGSINYKFWDNQLIESSYNLTTTQLLQIWGNVFDSNISFGILHNIQNSSDSLRSLFSTYFYYLQSIPLEWRQIGGAKYTASLEYKSIGISFRKEAFHFMIFGLGITYWNLTFDGITVSGPLPDGYFSIDF